MKIGIIGAGNIGALLTVTPVSMPEPASFVMAGTSALAGLGLWWRRRKGVVA